MIYIAAVTTLYLLFVFRLSDRSHGHTTKRAWPLLVIAATVHLAFFCTQRYVLAHHMATKSTYQRIYTLMRRKDGGDAPFIVGKCRISPDTTLRYAVWIKEPGQKPNLVAMSASADFVREDIALQDACVETSWDTLALQGMKKSAAWLLLNITGKYNRRMTVHLPREVRVDSVLIEKTDSTIKMTRIPWERNLLSSRQ